MFNDLDLSINVKLATINCVYTKPKRGVPVSHSFLGLVVRLQVISCSVLVAYNCEIEEVKKKLQPHTT